MNKVTKGLSATAALAAALGFAMTVNAAPLATAPGQNKLLCFDGTSDGGYGGICTLTSKGAKGSAVLDNTDGNVAGSYSGVYVEHTTLSGALIGAVKQLSFEYTGIPGAGAPRFSLPFDTNGDDVTDFYAFISAYYCNDGLGRVDAIGDSTCTIYAGSESFANWAAMVAAHPDWKITSDDLPFVIADEPGLWTVNNVKLGKGGK